METLFITVKDPDKKDFLLALLAELDFVQVKETPEIREPFDDVEEKNPIIGYDIDGGPLRAIQFERETREDIEAARKGDVIPLSDYINDTREWLNSTK